MFAAVVNLKLQTFTFTSLGAKGPSGPPSVDGYKGTTLDGEVVLKNGIQHWVVPRTGSYTIEAFGASGGNGTCLGCPGLKRGGLGARIKGEFWLTEGNVLLILVGQQGFWVDSFPDRPGGGGGGTFVTLASALTPLVVAGGGGGAGIDSPGYTDGDPGQTTTQGSRHGGNHGLGGSVRNTTPLKTILGGSGAGFYGNGYSGGGIEGSETTGSAGGGGSFNSGSAQESEADVNEGDGKVIITMLS
ncbi:predicted protein [Nematostella vectensis]|uniref:receptor protein-tyrosine kinase n=1 Tax=Nematostella vectensis TaxID=45351 RepID=A7RF90_NEMVE|nr:predicted protein [Nematostella vectensis]|eukprot:XP_001642121.1 predicted protein [Nematostella vectensis]